MATAPKPFATNPAPARRTPSQASSLSNATLSSTNKPVSLRWRVIEAPNPTPQGRTSATRPTRGRPRKHALSEKESRRRKKQEISIISWQAPTPVYQQPPPGAQLIPWACEWPEILQFYMTNTQGLDVSGRNLYSPTRYIPTTGAFLNAFHTSPGTLTLRILFAEASRPDRRSNLQKLLWLKGQALGLVNEALRDSNRQLSAGTLSDVVTMHNYEQVFGERDVAKMHRKGLKHLIDMMGGIENLRGDAAMLVPMILWSDRSRQARRLYDPTEDPPDYPTDFEAGLQPLHPLNIALLPPDQMTTSSGRSHALGISILGPGVRLMVALEALKRLASGATACRIYDNAPMTATIREKLHQAEQGLLAMQHDPDDKKEAIFFTNPKYALQQLMFDTVRLCGLVIVQLINAHLLERTHAARSKLDHALMRVGLVDISPLLEYYPRILLWIVFVQAPFLEESTRQSYSQLAGKACAKIGLESWEKVQQVLQSMYYYPEMQEAACERFWRTSTKEESPGVKQENTPPPEGPQPNESWHRFSREST